MVYTYYFIRFIECCFDCWLKFRFKILHFFNCL